MDIINNNDEKQYEKQYLIYVTAFHSMSPLIQAVSTS